MQKIVYLLFLSIFLIDLLDKYGLVPHVTVLLPELLSGVMLVFVVLWAAKNKQMHMGLAYWIVFLLLGLEIFFGIIVNTVSPGAVVSGSRLYFKFIPFFLLHAVHEFSGTDLKKQLLLLASLVLLQLPVSVYQRFIEGAGMKTGDIVKGTFASGGHQSIFLFCAISVLLAFYVRKYISMKMFSVFFLLFLIPATLNETKSSIFLLPAAILPVILTLEGSKEKIRAVVVAGVAATAFMALFVAAYDHFYIKKYDNAYEALDFFSEEGRFKAYLAPSTTLGSDRVGKIDKIVMPLITLSDDPIKLMFGLGMGNLTQSVVGSSLEGEYFEEYAGYHGATIPKLLWEVGVIGCGLVLFLWFLIMKDALTVSRRSDLVGTLALGWVGAMVVVGISLVYRNFMSSNALGYVIMYFCGYIVATRARMSISR